MLMGKPPPAVVAVAVLLVGCTIDTCPGGCVTDASASFLLSCSQNDLISVSADGPCSMPDAGLSWYTGKSNEALVAVTSRAPGTCHVVLTFASGFVYARDVTFTIQSAGRGCCPDIVAPTE